MSHHSPDCALVQYAHIDPATLKRPLECDGVECDNADPLPDVPDGPVDDAPSNVRPIRVTSDRVMLEGDAARAYRQLQSAEVALKAAQKRKDEALKAFLEAVTR
jgi:hypothetical protein